MNKNKYLFTFTASGKGRGVYTKLRLINEIKSYVTYLIANSNAEIHFFSNIELGHSLSNPHLHSQVWCDDKDAVKLIYERVIKKFGLVKKRCSLSEPLSFSQHQEDDKSKNKQSGPYTWTAQKRWSGGGPSSNYSSVVHTLGPPKNGGPGVVLKGEPQQQPDFYNYVIKDYSKDLNDNDLWKLEETKKRIRRHLGTKLRFYSRSKGKYQSKLYKIAYRSYGVLRAKADEWLDLILGLFFNKEAFTEVTKSSFIPIKNKREFTNSVFPNFLFFNCSEVPNSSILFFSPSRDPPFLT